MNEAQKWSSTPEAQKILKELQDELGGCMQCGTCTASCPNSHAMDLTPRQVWRLVQFGMLDEILDSKTFYLCSSCYMCTLNCPRGLKLTRAMGSLKRLARIRGDLKNRKNAAFYEAFMENIEKHGRVQELTLMPCYFFKTHDPMLPLHYIPMGMRMLRAKKLHLPKNTQKNCLREMFLKARSMEAAS
jgi:heterodisulfide reductase subunit C